MSTLAETLLSDTTRRPALIDACCRLIDDEVARKSGLRGMAVKGAFKAVKAIKPGFIRGVVDALFDEFVAQMESFFARWRESGSGTFGAALVREKRAVADSLLNVTDGRAERTSHKTARKLYYKLRPSAEGHVQDALPGMGRILDRYIDA